MRDFAKSVRLWGGTVGWGLLAGALAIAIVLLVIAVDRQATQTQVLQTQQAVLQAQTQDLRMLLLDGKTASAISARKTAREVAELLTGRKQTLRQQQATARLVIAVEEHFDASIKRAVNQAALRVAAEFAPKR